jgi:hypothetical protein
MSPVVSGGHARRATRAARHGAFAPSRQMTRRQARASNAATRAATVIVSSPGASTDGVRSRPVAMTGAGQVRRGVPAKTFGSDETPVHRATSLDAACGAAWRCRQIGVPDDARQLTSARPNLPQRAPVNVNVADRVESSARETLEAMQVGCFEEQTAAARRVRPVAARPATIEELPSLGHRAVSGVQNRAGPRLVRAEIIGQHRVT